MDEQSRRDVLRLGGLAVAGTLAGCLDGVSGASGSDGSPASTPTAQTSTDPSTVSTSTTDGTTGARPTETPSADDLQHRMDQRGGPDDLQSDPVIAAIDIEGDDGPAPYVFTPTVLWAEVGATVTWDVDGGAHAIAAYHPDNGRVRRVPEGASSFESGRLDVGDTFSYTVETPGVYNYYCQPHEYHGMVGIVVAGEARPGPGTVDGANVSVDVAGDHLNRLLTLAGIEVTPPPTTATATNTTTEQ